MLEHQRSALVERREALGETLALLDRTLEHRRREESPMGDLKSMFEGFDPVAYEEEVERRWGDTDAYAESRRRTARHTANEWAQAKADGEAVTEFFARLMAAGTPPGEEATRAAVEAHRGHIDRWFYTCSMAMRRSLAEMYVADERFAATCDRVRPGLAAYIREAILAHTTPG